MTFGLLMARARRITLIADLDRVAGELRRTNTLIGSALRLLTDNAENQKTLKTSLATLTRVLDAVHWDVISKGDPEAWLYFYERFLTTYDSELRRKTGSYYTPPEVVISMMRLVDEALKSGAYFSLTEGLASPDVTVADPATGTGTYLLGVLGGLIALESRQAGLLTRICDGPLISADTLRTAGAFDVTRKGRGSNADSRQDSLL